MTAVLDAVTLDFGNTLVPVGRQSLEAVVARTAEVVAERSGLPDRAAFRAAWAEERARQFREEVPEHREVDLFERVTRVLARLRGMAPPGPDDRWDDDAAAGSSEPGEVADIVAAYGQAFVDGMPAVPLIRPLLGRLRSRGLRLAIVSNWPLAATIDQYAEAAGWTPHLDAIIVSERVGVVKPHPAIFAAARSALGDPPPHRILHVGDDWAADVVGARTAGWRIAYVRTRPDNSPLPSSERDDSATVDVDLGSIHDLEAALEELEHQPGGDATA